MTTGQYHDIALTTWQYHDIALTTWQYHDIALTTGKYHDIALTTIQYYIYALWRYFDLRHKWATIFSYTIEMEKQNEGHVEKQSRSFQKLPK